MQGGPVCWAPSVRPLAVLEALTYPTSGLRRVRGVGSCALLDHLALGDLGAGSGSLTVRGQTYLSPRVLGFQVGDILPTHKLSTYRSIQRRLSGDTYSGSLCILGFAPQLTLPGWT